MKKNSLLLIALIFTLNFSYAQSNSWTTSGNNIYNSNTGYVGINTANPNNTLEVNGTTRLGGGIDYSSTTVLSVAPGTIGFDAPGISGGRFFLSGSTGNVGIGTASPQFTLDVNGSSGFKGAVVLYGSNNGGQSNTDSPNLIFQGTNYAGASMISAPREETYGRRGFAISTHSDPSDTRNLVERFRITYLGNVGIGTTTPDQKLTVNGAIHAKEVIVDLNIPAPDYVFEKNYKLKSLDEINRYVTFNKHLPEIPSAKSMAKNGINVSELNMKLLQKVEELTLYLIDKDKEIKAGHHQLAQQAERIDELEQTIKNTKHKQKNHD
jgi:hypothetical protein